MSGYPTGHQVSLTAMTTASTFPGLIQKLDHLQELRIDKQCASKTSDHLPTKLRILS